MTVVAIDAVHLRPGGKGVARVLANIAPRLLGREDEQIRYVALTTQAGAELLGGHDAGGVVVVPEMLDTLWVHRALPVHALQAGADLLYLHREVGPLWGPQYILHVPEDPAARWARIPPGAWRVKARAELDRMLMPHSVRRARSVATSTDATARNLARKFAVPRDRIQVVPLGVDSVFRGAEQDPGARARQHIFHLGSEDSRDNTLAVLHAYAWLRAHAPNPPPPLVVAGGLGRLGPSAAALAQRAGRDCVSVLGRVSDEELHALYKEAVVCVQPSSDEGFGLQPLEAMAAGAPVVALDTPAAREVLGTAAHLARSPAPEVLGSAMDRLLLQGSLREELERQGLERSKTFTWERTTDLLHALVVETTAERVTRKGGRSGTASGWRTGRSLGARSPSEGAEKGAARLMVLTSIIAPYRIPVFNALAASHGLDLRVVYLSETEPRRSWPIYRDDIHHDYGVLRDWAIVPAGNSYVHISRGLLSEVIAWRPHVVVAGAWDQPAMLLAYLLRRRVGYAFAWWVESTERDARRLIRLPRALKARLIRGSDAMIVPGRASSRYISSLGALPEKIAIAPNAVDMHFFASHGRRDRSVRDGCRFLYVGSLHPLKGLDVLLDAWSLLGHPSAMLTVVGDGPARQDVGRRAALAAVSSVRLTGHLDREALAAEYASADVFVFPSLSDPWGLVLNEAMACGLPVVTTSAPGAAEDLVSDGWNGYVVRPGDAVALAEAMRALAADADLRASMGRRSLERIAGFSPDRCAEGLAEGARRAVRLRTGAS
jgi:glycosyltransferase involved in cell wall biosynthesis